MFGLFHMAGWTIDRERAGRRPAGPPRVTTGSSRAARRDRTLTARAGSTASPACGNASSTRRQRNGVTTPRRWWRYSPARRWSRSSSSTRSKARFPGSWTSVAYGSTEIGRGLVLLDSDLYDQPGSVGQPPPMVVADLADDGELWLRGPTMFSGLPRPAGRDRRGDRRGRLVPHRRPRDRATSDGFFTITGRRSESIRSGGEWVAPVEVETAVLTHPAVAEVGVVGLPDERWGELVCAVIVVRPGATLPTVDELRCARGVDPRRRQAAAGGGAGRRAASDRRHRPDPATAPPRHPRRRGSGRSCTASRRAHTLEVYRSLARRPARWPGDEPGKRALAGCLWHGRVHRDDCGMRQTRRPSCVAGEVDLATAPELRLALMAITGDVTVDLARVSFMDSSGLGALVAARKRTADPGHRFTVRNESDLVEPHHEPHRRVRLPPCQGASRPERVRVCPTSRRVGRDDRMQTFRAERAEPDERTNQRRPARVEALARANPVRRVHADDRGRRRDRASRHRGPGGRVVDRPRPERGSPPRPAGARGRDGCGVEHRRAAGPDGRRQRGRRSRTGRRRPLPATDGADGRRRRALRLGIGVAFGRDRPTTDRRRRRHFRSYPPDRAATTRLPRRRRRAPGALDPQPPRLGRTPIGVRVRRPRRTNPSPTPRPHCRGTEPRRSRRTRPSPTSTTPCISAGPHAVAPARVELGGPRSGGAHGIRHRALRRLETAAGGARRAAARWRPPGCVAVGAGGTGPAPHDPRRVLHRTPHPPSRTRGGAVGSARGGGRGERGSSTIAARDRPAAATEPHAASRSPDSTGSRPSARYEAGVEGTEVGGDWYDVLPVSGNPPGVLGGRRLRSRARRGRAHGVAAVLHPRLRAGTGRPGDHPRQAHHRSWPSTRSDDFATVVCGTLDTVDGALTVAAPGIPTSWWWSATALATSTRRSDRRWASTPTGGMRRPPTPCPTDATLLAFTDGLVERRRESLDDRPGTTPGRRRGRPADHRAGHPRRRDRWPHPDPTTTSRSSVCGCTDARLARTGRRRCRFERRGRAGKSALNSGIVAVLEPGPGPRSTRANVRPDPGNRGSGCDGGLGRTDEDGRSGQ